MAAKCKFKFSKIELIGRVTLPFDKEEDHNLIKILLSDSEGFTEGIWAQISDEDMVDYKADKTDEKYTRVAVLRNNALMGPPYGCLIPYKLNGDQRPVSVMDQWVGKDKIAFHPELKKK